MSTTTSTTSTTIPTSIGSTTFQGATISERPTRFDDDTSHRLAVTHAAVAPGLAHEPTVTWDCDHVLQGHLYVAGRPFVLIAARTSDRLPHLSSEQEWDGVCHGQGVARRVRGRSVHAHDSVHTSLPRRSTQRRWWR